MQTEINGEIVKYEPYKDNLYIPRMKLRLQQDRTFRNVFKYDLTERFFADLRNTTNPNHQFIQNTIIAISGLTGTSKSMTALSLGLKFFKDFSYKNMMFFDQEILDKADSFPENSVIIRDEDPSKAVFGVGSTRTTGELVTLSETVRKAGLSLIFIEPSFTQNAVVKMYLETVDMDIEHRITRVAMRDAYTLRYMGCALIPIVPESNIDWIKYNEVKDTFIASVRKGDYSGSKMKYQEIAEEMMDHEDFYLYRNKKERKSFITTQHPSLTLGEIDIICTLLEVTMRKQEEEKL